MGGSVGIAVALIALIPVASRMAALPEKRPQVLAVLIVGTGALVLATAGVVGAIVLLLVSGASGFAVFNTFVWFLPGVLQVVAACLVWRGTKAARPYRRRAD